LKEEVEQREEHKNESVGFTQKAKETRNAMWNVVWNVQANPPLLKGLLILFILEPMPLLALLNDGLKCMQFTDVCMVETVLEKMP
jgi:hypothetical protein